MDLSLENDKAEERRNSDHAGVSKVGVRKGAKAKGKQSPEVGQALRAIYEHTIDEDIPPHMLDLLGKLD